MPEECAAEARPAQAKEDADIAREWDAIAVKRFSQLRSQEDLTYRYILEPTVMGLTSLSGSERVIDAGCGSGFLTAQLGLGALEVIGVDPSRGQIQLARRYHSRCNVEYVVATLEAYAKERRPRGDVIVANMTLMDVLALPEFLGAARETLHAGGRLVATITHPCFWPRYWNYEDASWFEYGREIVIEAPFRISLAQEPIGKTTHVHRPLALYLSAIADAGFCVEVVSEPLPPPEAVALYPSAWRTPRYLAIRANAT